MNSFYLALVSLGGLAAAVSISDPSIVASEQTTTSLAQAVAADGSIVLTADVQTLDGAGVPGGTIRFIDDTTLMVLGWADPAHPSARIAPLPPGEHRLFAAYGGSAEFLPQMLQPSRSAVLIHTVRETPDAVLSSSLNPCAPGDVVTLTATFGHGGDRPHGTVNFRDGDAVIAAHVALNQAGTASFTTSALPDGLRTITADYEGDARHRPRRSPQLAQEVTARRIQNSLLETR